MRLHFLRRRTLSLAAAGLLATAALLLGRAPGRTSDPAPRPDRAAVERARATSHMLDDLYKTYVVEITGTYVKAQERTPAAHVTKKVFKAMAAKGWHTGRLVDATGSPLNAANTPRTAFEKGAVAQLKGGKPWVEEVGVTDGKPVLRVATPVPVVMDACLKCHTEAKEKDLLGALVYEIPVR